MPTELDFRLKRQRDLFAVVIGLFVFWLQYRSLYCGETRGFDSMIYARSIWGIASGNFWNPVRETHVFAVHATWVMFVLAPLTMFLKSATVLAVSQGVAIGLTTHAVVAAVQEGAVSYSRATLVSVIAVVCGILAPAYVINPFLNDARPDVLLIPLLTLAFLRVRKVGDWDRLAMGFAIAAVMCREEVAVVTAFALWVTPRRTPLLSNRTRALVSCALVGYVALYYFPVRALLSDRSALDPLRDFTTGTDGGGGDVRDLLLAKLTLIGAALLGGAPFLWRGWRWLPAAIPGALVLLTFRFDPPRQVALHYAMFCSPAVLVAIVEGIQFYAARNRKGDLLSAVPVAMANYLLFGVLPHGKFYVERYRFDGVTVLDPFACGVRDVDVFNAQLAKIPSDATVLASAFVGARLADRPTLFTTTVLHPEQPDSLPLYVVSTTKEDWRANARKMAPFGYRAAAKPSDVGVILTRDTAAGLAQWKFFQTIPRDACQHSRAKYPAAGINVCVLERRDGVIHVFLQREHDARTAEAKRGLRMVLQAPNTRDIPVEIFSGLGQFAEMPVGFYGWAESQTKVPNHDYKLNLIDSRGRVLETVIEQRR